MPLGKWEPLLAVFMGQGFAPTSVEKGDVTIGLNAAIENLKDALGIGKLEWEHFLASRQRCGGAQDDSTRSGI